MSRIGIVIHGGAGTISKSKMTKWKAEAYREALKRAYTVGFITLEKGGSALSAIMESIQILEDSTLFNAGKGSVLTHEGKTEMDAAIMEGNKLRAGAVAGVTLVKNPIKLAYTVMKQSKHVLISGENALNYARDNGLEIETEDYFYNEERYKQWLKAKKKNDTILDHDDSDDKKFGTVGAVALDKKGNLAAGTSTGGMVNKMHGRIGDSPLIGIGTYANNLSCAISCTGHGEFFIRSVVAHEISARMLYKGQSLEDAANDLVYGQLPAMGGKGGLIGMDQAGNVVMPFNTRGMYRAYKSALQGEFVGLFKDDDFSF